MSTSDFTITIRQKGIPGAEGLKYRETFTGDDVAAERRATTLWNYPEWSSGAAVDRYQLKLHRKGDRKAYVTIG